MKVKVRALKHLYEGGVRRSPDDEFELEEERAKALGDSVEILSRPATVPSRAATEHKSVVTEPTYDTLVRRGDYPEAAARPKRTRRTRSEGDD